MRREHLKTALFQSLENDEARISNHWKLFAAAWLALAGNAAAGGPDFTTDVRPILSQHCFKCHGPDEQKRDSGLRLDLREAATGPAKSGRAAIVPGRPGQSELVRRIFSDDPKVQMPPPAANAALYPAQKETLGKWIAAGAEYRPHWAFVAPEQPPLPAVSDGGWPQNPIDRFVLARLDREGLKPSPAADPLMLCRRVYLDLIGLPPTPEEADAFVAAATNGLRRAVEDLADKLLASPHYGERWARRWLDLAMYADTNGYEKDRQRSIWPYRDWVIGALNAGMPFDQFSILQLAGDMLPERELPAGTRPVDARIATGFLRNTMLNEEGGIDPLEYRFAAMTTRMQMTGAAWMGLTLQCAQCHTHKFDPISHREYYALMAFLNNADEPELDLPPADAAEQEAGRAERAAALLAALPDKWPVPITDARPVRPLSVVAAGGERPRLLDDGSALFAGAGPATDSYTLTFETDQANVDALRLDALTDDQLPSRGPGRVAHGNFVLSEITVTAAPRGEPDKVVPVRIARASADVEQENYPVAAAIDGNPGTGWAVQKKDGKLNAPKTATFVFEKPVSFAGGTRFVVKLDQNHGGQHTLGRVRLAVSTAEDRNRTPEQPRALAERAFAGWLQQQRATLTGWKTIRPVEATSNMPLLQPQDDGTVLCSGDTTKHDTYTLRFSGDFRGVTAIRLEALPDDSLPGHGPGMCYYEGPKGDFFLGEFSVAAAGATQRIASATESFAKNNFGDRAVSAMAATDGDLQTGWSCAGRFGERHEAVFNFAAPVGEAQELAVKMDFGRHYACSLGRFRLSISRDERPAVARNFDDETAALLAMDDSQRSPAQRQKLFETFLLTTPELAGDARAITAMRRPAPQTTTLVLRERPANNPRTTRLQHRGEFLQPEGVVGPDTPAILPPLADAQPRTRLGFARWLVSPENPLTARVTVNRQWAALFGDGIVRTVADFGYQGEVPSHPALLDWLAVEFVRQGWSLKNLHRLIVTSATYQQASSVSPALYARDPLNRLLARGPRVRLEAELVRDAVLRASGQLSTRIGGPSVFPPQPAGITTEGAYGRLDWKESQGEDRYRRALYTFAKRTAPYAMFTTFDAPSGEACIARREVSNSALQALTALNDRVFTEAGQALATLLAKQDTTVEARVRELFRRCLTRAPDADEVSLLVRFFESQKRKFSADEAGARLFAGDGEQAAERAAWAATARILFNLDEFVTKG